MREYLTLDTEGMARVAFYLTPLRPRWDVSKPNGDRWEITPRSTDPGEIAAACAAEKILNAGKQEVAA